MSWKDRLRWFYQRRVLPVLRRIRPIAALFLPSQEIFPTFEDWLQTQPSAAAASNYLIPVHEPYSLTLPDPIIIPQTQDTAHKPAEHNERATSVAHLSWGYVTTAYCEVLTPDRKQIHEFLINEHHLNTKNLLHSNAPYLPRTVKHQGRYATIFNWHCATNYAYWLLDGLARLWVLEEGGIQNFKLIVPKEAAGYQRESLALMGYPPECWTLIDDDLHRFEELFVPSFAQYRYYYPNPRAMQWLRQRFLHAAAPKSEETPRRIYVSRAKTSVPRLVNEADLLEVLADRGFTVIYPEELSFKQQMQLYQSADVAVGVFGAGLANHLFMREGASVIEMTLPHIYTHYVRLSAGLGLTHLRVLGTAIEEATPDQWHPRFTVSPEQLAAALDRIGC